MYVDEELRWGVWYGDDFGDGNSDDEEDAEGDDDDEKCSDTRPDKTTWILWELLDAARHSYFVG